MTTKPFSSVLDQVPAHLGKFEQLSALQALVLEAGWRWPAIEPVLDKAQEELNETREAFATGSRVELVGELGDLVFMATLLCHYAEIDPQEALTAAIAKLKGRFGYIERRAHETGRTVKDIPHDEERRWYAEYKASEKKSA